MKTRRWIEKTLLLAGIIGLGVWTWSRVSSAIFQDWQSWSFDREMRGQSVAITEYLVEKEGQIAAVVRTWLSPTSGAPGPHSSHTGSATLHQESLGCRPPRYSAPASERDGSRGNR